MQGDEATTMSDSENAGTSTPLRFEGPGALDRALALVRFLRAECDWDRAQTAESLIPHLLEETHEVVDAIHGGDAQALEGELGDLLLNLAFQIVVAEEAEEIDAESVYRRLEEKMIAREVVRTLKGPTSAIRSVRARPIPVGVSVRHVHLSRAHCDALFGPGYELTRRREVTQKGQYVTRETVDIVGPKGELRGVAIINPLRAETQERSRGPTRTCSG